MLALISGQSAKIIVTLNEKKTLLTGYYLFVFTHITTRDKVSVIFNFSDDESLFQDRYNKFNITNTVFSGKDTGTWRYEVYEQASASNTDITGLTEVERGIMQLLPSTEFSFETYDGLTSFKTYNGN